MTFSYLTGVCKAAIEGLNETRERVGYEKLYLSQKLCEDSEAFAKQLVAEGRFGRDRKLRGAAECNFMSRTGQIKLSTYKLAFESWLSQYNRFDWDNPEEGNNWSNLMHKNVKEIGIGAALTKGGNAIVIARVTPVPDLNPETLHKLLPTDQARLPQAYYSFGAPEEEDDFLSLWSKNLGPGMRKKTAPVKVVKMPEKPKSRSSLSAVKFGKERNGSERDSGIKEEDSNEDVFSSGLIKDRSFGDDMPYGTEKFGKTPIPSPFVVNDADVSFADGADYGKGVAPSQFNFSNKASTPNFDRSFGDDVKFGTEHFGKSDIWSEPHLVRDTSFGDEMPYGSEAVPTPLHFESRGRLITRESDNEIIQDKKSKKKVEKQAKKATQEKITSLKVKKNWAPKVEVRLEGATDKLYRIVNGVFKFVEVTEAGEGLYYRSNGKIWLRCQATRISFAPTKSEKGCWIFAKNTSAGNFPASGWKMFSEQKWSDVKSLSIWSV
ncbi:unnamed protein product [Oikopleura dioica]|uniref:SCP domain-containing protein n=1 Tax=Oikopleura dioica TaxID=34765 RepID=E4YN45_OIKDI|nr:unnamed protein product [Oikopleura dioica]